MNQEEIPAGEVLRILKGGREKVASGWTKHADARTTDGHAIDPESPFAVAFCAKGACWAAEPTWLFRANAAVAALKAATPSMWGTCVEGFNDRPDTTKADVLALFDRAIAREERV